MDSETKVTPKLLIDKFIARDVKAVEELHNWFNGPVTEGRRLEFLEGRVMDLCGVVIGLCKYIQEKEDAEAKSKTF